MNYGAHVRACSAKADGATAKLSRLMPNIEGASTNKRKVLCGVTHSILLYGSPVWSGMVEKIPAYQNLLLRSQRKALLRVAWSYKTVSAEALQTITRTLPIDLMAKERRLLHISGQGQDPQVRSDMLKEWQNRWSSLTAKAQWTKGLIPTLEAWINCSHCETDFHLTQFFTGHGPFRAFTYRINETQDDKCLYCGMEDTAEHTVLKCPRWQQARNEAEKGVGAILEVGNIVSHMTKSRSGYEKISKFIRTVMKTKEAEERAKEKGEYIF